MKKFIKISYIILLVIGLALFNGFFLYCIYKLGVTPLAALVGYELPTITYLPFVGLHLTISGIHQYLKGNNNTEQYDLKDTANVTIKVLSMILNKFITIIILGIVGLVCF